MKAADLQLTRRFRSLATAAVSLLAIVGAAALAATTDIANAPLFTSSATQIKPNIMFILDDSGSMGWDFLPDEAGNFSMNVYGFRAAQCNGVAYDPNVVYKPPVDAAGTVQANGATTFMDPASQVSGSGSPTTTDPLYSATSLNSIASTSWPASSGGTVNYVLTGYSGRSSPYATDGSQEVTVYGGPTQFLIGVVTGWTSSSGTVTIKVWDVVGTGALSSPKIAKGVANTYFTYSGTQKKLGYSYNSNSTLITSSTFYQECSSAIGSTPGSGVFTGHAVGTSSAEAQNYANWNQYYRTRIKMMQTSISWAFKGIDDRYRVGFSTISARTAAEGTTFLNIRDFNATQKSTFYSDMNAANPAINTPLRGALAKAGQYYANKAPSQSLDPVQYSCQRNFTILSTDGYWNTGYETSTYGPYQLDGITPVGQQDGGGTPRPMFDGGTVTRTTTETWTVTTVTNSTTYTPSVVTSSTITGTTTTGPSSASPGKRQTTYVPETTSVSLSGANMVRTGGNLVTVTMSNHGLSTGDYIAVSGGNNSTKDFRTSTNVPITVVNANTFTYADNGTNGTASGSYTFDIGSNLSCGRGQSIQRQVTQQRDSLTSTTVSATDSSTQNQTTTFTTTKTDKQPYTRVVISVNGTVVSDTTSQGTLSTSSTNSTPVTTTGTAVLSHQPNTPAPTSTASTTGWTTVSQGGLSCQSTSSPPVTSDAASYPPLATTTTTVVQNGPTRTGPTTTNGTTTVVINSQTSSESAHTSKSAVTSSSGGSSNTLADVAMYYYQTDLRDTSLGNCTGVLGSDVCLNNVPGNTSDAAHSYGDSATWQHMTTFTLGLGASGLLRYDPNYLTQLSGDYFDITNSSKNWPAPVSTTSGGEPPNIDDLWHAAVNGRGQYFSAGDPTSLTNSLNSALDSIKAVTGAASAASTSTLQPVQGDNDVFSAQFTTQKWVGDVLDKKIDPLTGAIADTPTWSAKAQLDAQSAASRTIYYPNPSGASTLRTFTYANLTTDGYNGNFDSFCSKTGANGAGNPTQCTSLGTTDLASANLGSNLVNYLRGDQTQSYYRARDNLLGDIINASPLFVGKPSFKYTENNYQTFVTANASRTAIVLAAANDGMLHAFDRNTGNELWAFIPSFVMPNLYKLADYNYPNNHSFFVDGSPQVGDVWTGTAWRTIVVGGLNAGGRGYYALDVTDTTQPKLLWEFRNDNLGLSFGNPIITKRANGTWAVVFTSGYNNVNPGDGNGHLFVVDANTGTLLDDIQTYSSGTTPVGSTTTPSGLGKLNDFVDSETNNSAKRYYAGDMLGNLWRFDIDNLVAPNHAALRFAQLTDPSGNPQPITTQPAMAEVNYNGSKYPVVYVATGRYLGTTDLSNTQVQTVYAIKEPLTASGYGPVRTVTSFVRQTITASGTNRTSTSNPVDWTTKTGWFDDLPAGERVAVDPQLALQTLHVASNLPSSDACTVGGQSFLYEFDIGNGQVQSQFMGNVMIEGLTLVQLVTGASAGTVETLITRGDGKIDTSFDPASTAPPSLRRTSWRELVE